MLKSLFFKLCYRLGFYPTKIRSPENTYAFLKAKPDLLKEEELRKLSYAIALSKDQKYYTQLLKQFVPNWKENQLEEATFIGEGYGKSSLNAYRKVKISGDYFFEKVYFNAHHDLQKLKIMEEQGIADYLAKKITLPRIQKIESGELLSIVYFDYLEIDPSTHAQEEKLIELSKILYQYPVERWNAEAAHQPTFLMDFKQHHQYEKFISTASEILQKQDLEIESFEQKAKVSKRIATHGDLQKTNVFKPNIIMDWDSFGFYPIGFEVAFLFFRLVFKENKKEDPFNWLQKNYQMAVDQDEWEIFEQNFTFFLFVFAQEIFVEYKENELESILLKKLKNNTT